MTGIANVFQALKSKRAAAEKDSQARLRALVSQLASGNSPDDLESAIADLGLNEAQLEQLVAEQTDRRKLKATIDAAQAQETERAKVSKARTEKQQAFLAQQKKLQEDYIAADSRLAVQERACQAAIDAAGQARLTLATALPPIHLQAEIAAARAAHDEADREYMFFSDPDQHRSAEREQIRARREALADQIARLAARCTLEID